MPPKKLSISQIRAQSRMRSDDPDLNRSSSYNRGSSSSSSSNRASQSYRTVASSSSSGLRASSRPSNPGAAKRPKWPPQPKTSARILHIQQDDIEETRVQNLFAPHSPTRRQNVSYRPLTLTQQALRDGDAFRLPSLSSLCCSVIASCFDALLPSRDHFQAAAGTSASISTPNKPIKNAHTLKKSSGTRKRSRATAFGAAPNSDEDQEDYLPSDQETPPANPAKPSARATRNHTSASTTANRDSRGGSSSNRLLAGWTTSELHYLTRKTSEHLKLLSPAASFLLFRALAEQAPQYLTKTVVSNFFLPPILNSSSRDITTAASRTHVWLPASIPLLSHDKSAASFLVAHLNNALSSAGEHRRPPSLSQSADDQDVPLAALPSRILMAQPASFALRSLQLHGLTRLQDATIAHFFETAIPRSKEQDPILRLDLVSLRGCIAIGDRTLDAICRSTGTTLRYLNLDLTDITADSVASIMKLAPNLDTLKLGYNENLSDKTLQVALQAPASGALPFSKLVNLRLRQCTQVADAGVACFLKYAHRTLEVLDISGTGVGGTNPHNPDFLILLTFFFPLGVPSVHDAHSILSLRKLNLLDTNIHYPSLIRIIDRAPNMDTLLIRQTPSRTTRDGTIELLEKLTSAPSDGGWRNRSWKRLHFKILDVGDEFADLFPRLLSIFPQLHLHSLKSSQSLSNMFFLEPDQIDSSSTIVQHLNLPDARLSERAWQFLPLITTLRTLDVSNTAVPEYIIASTIERNPYLELVDLSHCKQIRISTRRNAFSLAQSHHLGLKPVRGGE
ncbi:hypothetical protein NDA14_001473 [Ustilago hordei]|nr:hypothetical protein NDA14_001473 [Ustilago hordei]